MNIKYLTAMMSLPLPVYMDFYVWTLFLGWNSRQGMLSSLTSQDPVLIVKRESINE
jgi:hypothetical protein